MRLRVLLLVDLFSEARFTYKIFEALLDLLARTRSRS
jgi:hypothetical protein